MRPGSAGPHPFAVNALSETICDALGQFFQPTRQRRIVSLVPSLTETVFAYGLGHLVAGITRYCTEPADRVEQLPRLGGTKDPDVRGIRAIEPDLVLASSEENRKEDVQYLLAEGFKVFVTLPTSVRSALEMLTDVAALLGAGVQADRMTGELRATLAEVEDRMAGRPPVPYFCPIWRRPYMTSGPGTYAHDLLVVCGGRSVCGAGEGRYFPVELESVAAGMPELILLPDEPYPFSDRHKAEFEGFRTGPDGSAPAVHCVDGKALTWYGPRSAGALRLFAGLFASANSAS
jgi:ABC-type Fe3+-hydroxamate transport system substrate-binding protein